MGDLSINKQEFIDLAIEIIRLDLLRDEMV